MRFSDLPLSRRIVAAVITFAICVAIYWVARSISAALPFAANAVLSMAVVGFGIWAIWYDKRRRNRLLNRRQLRPSDRHWRE